LTIPIGSGKLITNVGRRIILKKGVSKIEVLIISVIIIATLITDYKAFRLSSAVLKEKKELKIRLDGLVKINSSHAQTITALNAQLKDLQDKLLQKDARITELNSSKDTLAAQLQEANTRLTVLTEANSFLEKQIEELDLSRKSPESGLSKMRKQ